MLPRLTVPEIQRHSHPPFAAAAITKRRFQSCQAARCYPRLPVPEIQRHSHPPFTAGRDNESPLSVKLSGVLLSSNALEEINEPGGLSAFLVALRQVIEARGGFGRT
ncbi:hypothetical protein ZG96_004465 [Salmonella enterica subsp. enterica serovar Java]|nr:hypothetical protein [Salmonella enterica subsp. enterica serovar Java]EJC3483602.1 hypothetical protein [Salmonella enterica]